MRYARLAFLASIFLPNAALRADIQNCNGVWTNSDCSSLAQQKIVEKAYRPQSEEERVTDRKRFLFNDLDLRRLAANREHNLSFDVSVARDICLAADSALEECQRVVAEAHTQLGEQIAAARANQTAAKPQDDLEPSRNVVIVQNNQDDVYRGRRPRRDRDPHHIDRPLGPPKPRPELGSIWDPPGNSIPRTVPTKREGHRHPERR